MKLVLYSGGDDQENLVLDHELCQLINHPDPVFTFIPSSFEHAEEDYQMFIDEFSSHGVRHFQIVHCDRPLTDQSIHKLRNGHLIFISGGNTYYLLKNLRENAILPELKKFARSGGVLAGLSAGAILITPDIKSASYPEFDCDDNDVKLSDLASLDLVSLEFFPHYLDRRSYSTALLEQSLNREYPIYACPDGSGIIIQDEKKTFVGECFVFFQGASFKI